MFNFIFRLLKLQKGYVLMLTILLLYFFSCNNSDEDFTLGKDFIDNTTEIIHVDTFSLELSTVKIDSVITSATETILVGCYVDGNFGRVIAQSYFQIGLPSTFDIQSDDRFDSLTLVMPYSTYYYGDTNAIQQIDVYRLSEKLDISYYYNTSEVDYFSSSIGQKRYYPRPNRDSIVEIRIDDFLGQDIFEKMKYETEEVSSSEEFQNYIYGFVVVPNESESSSIIGFNNVDLKVKMYTSRVEEDIEEIIYHFPSSSVNYQFNQIKSDRTGTVLENLIFQEEELISSTTNNKSYVQAGIGIVTKIKFPYLESIFFDENDLILSVELRIKPEIESYEGNFPESLALYETNQNNNVVIELQDEDGASVISTFNLDDMYHLDTYYSFDLTDFLQEQLDEGYIDNERGLLITVPAPEYNSSLERLIISNDKGIDKRPVLKITYLRN